MADRPNFFELLGLDPEQEADAEAIEKRIEAKKRDWARDVQSNPKRRQEAKRNLGLLPEIRRVLGDPQLRCQEAEAARRLRQEKARSLESELAESIALLQTSGRCRPEQLAKICSQFAGVFSEAEIRRRLASAGVRIVERRTWERTDASIAKDIRSHLALLKLASLYEVLGLPPTASAVALCARADEIYRENNSLGRTDATASAQNILAGHAKTVFSNEEDKKKYDNELVLAAFESLDHQILLAGDDKVLSAQEVQHLVRLAVERGVSATDALDLLEERAAKEGWRLEVMARNSNSSDPFASPATDSQRKLGVLPVRGIAAGLALLTLGCGTAFLMGLPPFPPQPSVSSTRPAVSTSYRPLTSGPQARPSQTAPGPGNTGSAVIPAPSPSRNPQIPGPSGGSASGSASASPATAALGSSSSRPSLLPPPLPPAAVFPTNPEVAVIAIGDPLLASPLESELEDALRGAGLGVVSNSPALEDLRRHRSDEPSVSSILSSLHDDGVHAAIIAQVEPLADRALQYYQRQDVVSISRVRIHAYLVNSRRALGSGWTDQIEYNGARAEIAGVSAAHRAAPDLAEAVRNAWGYVAGGSP